MSSFRVTNIDGRWSAVLNGTDIASIIRDGSLTIQFQPGGRPPLISMQLVTTELDVELPEAHVELVSADAA